MRRDNQNEAKTRDSKAGREMLLAYRNAISAAAMISAKVAEDAGRLVYEGQTSGWAPTGPDLEPNPQANIGDRLAELAITLERLTNGLENVSDQWVSGACAQIDEAADPIQPEPEHAD